MRRPIGIFDSGLGGISVLKEAVHLMPNEHFIFYGDNENAPYGTKTQEQIDSCVQNVVDQLLQRDIKALLIACNTATAASAKRLRSELTIPVIGMEPALKPAHELRHGGQILVLATPATLHMDKFLHLMELYGEGAVPVEGYGIVECVEDGQVRGERILSVLHGLLDEHLKKKTDAIVLGCTHYPLIREALSQVAPGIPLIDGNLGTVRQLRRVLERDGMLCPPGEPGGFELHTTGDEAIYLPRMRLLMDLAPTT
ncbi:MAG: glutamate racemase [Candidatus Spyradocola sp.]|nr:glutamate racemase [Candidatus Spyradocola sp.]